MVTLSHLKLKQEVYSMESIIIRARVQMCRKLIADIKKLSHKKAVDKSKNEKNSRKIKRLTEEVHILRHLKPTSIANFALLHTEESAILVRERPDVKPHIKALAKVSLHKLIKPLVQAFHEKYPTWAEVLPKLIKNNTEGMDEISLIKIGDGEDNFDKNFENNDMIVESDESESSNKDSSNQSNENSLESLELNSSKFKLNENSLSMFPKKDLNLKLKIPAKKRSKSNCEGNSDKLREGIDNIPVVKKSKLNRFEWQEEKLDRKSLTDFSLKSEEDLIMSKKDKVEDSTVEIVEDKNQKENSDNLNYEFKRIKDEESMKMENFKNNKDVETDEESVTSSDDSSNESVKNSLESLNSSEFKLKTNFTCKKNESTFLEKKNVEKRESEISSDDSSKQSVESSLESLNSSQFKLKTNYTCKKNETTFLEKKEVEKGENLSLLNLHGKSHQKNVGEDKIEHYIDKNKHGKELEVKKESKILDKVTKNENKYKDNIVVNENTVQQQEDPFFLTSDNKKYMTFGKIVEEPKIEPSFSVNRNFNYNFKYGSNYKKEFNKNSFSKVKDNSWNRESKFDRIESMSESTIKLHPSWEAKRKSKAILPFQGKKISFND